MEAISIGYLILSTLSVTQNVYKLAHSVRDSGPKVDAIFYRLIAEKERTEGWANQMRIMNGADLRSKIPPGKYDEVRVLLAKLEHYYQRAEKKYCKIQNPGTSQEKRRYAMLAAKVKFIALGYDDLKDVVDTIAAMNKALKAIAPPLPSYTPAGYAEGPPVSSILTYPVEERSSLSMTNPVTSVTLAPASVRSARLAAPMPDFLESDDSSSALEPYKPSLHDIYQLCLDTLIILSGLSSRRAYSNPASRLKLWGAGVFGRLLPLDQLMKNGSTRSLLPLRHCLLETFTHILIVEERDLTRLREQPQHSTEQLIEQLQKKITGLLGTDEVVHIAVRRWANLLLHQGRDQNLERNPDPTKIDIKSIAMTIEYLFDLLPAIREERRAYFLYLEWAEKRKAADISQQQQTAFNGQSTEEDSMVQNLEEVDRILKMKDKSAASQANLQGKRVKLYSPLFQKERERLADFYSARSDEDVRSMTPEEEKKFRQKQAQLAEILAKFVKQSQTSKEQGIKRSPSPYKIAEKMKGADAKAQISEEDDENLDAFLDSLRDPISEIWNITGSTPVSWC